MRTKLYKITIAAGVGLAMAFLMSCGTDSDDVKSSCIANGLEITANTLQDIADECKASRSEVLAQISGDNLGSCKKNELDFDEKIKDIRTECGVSSIPVVSPNDGKSSPSGGGSFSVNSQVYNEDGTKFTGNGVLKIYLWNYYVIGEDLLDFGKVENGIVKLDPMVPEDKYLSNVNEFSIEASDCPYAYGEEEEGVECGVIPMTGCTFSPSDGKYYLNEQISLFIGSSEYGVSIGGENEQNADFVMHGYFSKATKINCTETKVYGDITSSTKISIDAKAGWNEIYYHSEGSGNCVKEYDYYECSNRADEFSTNKSIIKQDVKWTLGRW